VRFFYDCEFIETVATIDLVSIGVVDEEGREFYAVSTEFDPDRAGQWVRQNVLPKLPPPASPVWMSRGRLRQELLNFVSPNGESAELWAWFAAYDHVALVPSCGAPCPICLASCPDSPVTCGNAGTTWPAEAAAAPVGRPRRAGRRPGTTWPVGRPWRPNGSAVAAQCSDNFGGALLHRYRHDTLS